LKRVCLAWLFVIGVASRAGAQSTLVLSTSNIVSDTTIRGGSYASLNDSGGVLVTKQSGDPSYVRRALLSFDTESTLPPRAIIQSARLTMTVRSGGAGTSRAIGIFPVTRSFTSTEATWDMATRSTPWSKPGGDYGPRVTVSNVTNVAGGKATFDVTALVQAAVNSSSSRQTRLALRDAGPLETAKGGYREYYSMEASDPAVRPKLTIVYGAATTVLPVFSHVVTIIFENHEYGSIIGNSSAPYFNSLARSYGLGTAYDGIMHPSLPNYMALTGGRTAFTTDCYGCTTSAPSIVDQVESSGRTWRAYMESMTSPCLATDSGLYAQKHNPFVHYSVLLNNRPRCEAHVIPRASLVTHLQSGNLADYTWITPNMCNDMHDCSVATGDKWLSTYVPAILASPAWDGNSVLFIVFDEGTTATGGGGRIPFIVVSGRTPAGTVVSTPYNHYNLLATIEQSWGLPRLGNSSGAAVMTDFFK